MLLEEEMYDKLLDAILKNEIDYNDIVVDRTKPNNDLLDDPKFKAKHDSLYSILYNLHENPDRNYEMMHYEQSDFFQHYGINFNDDKYIHKIRIYMMPENEYIINIVYELLKRSFKKKEDILLKYCLKENREDKIVMYLKNQKDYEDKIKTINEIKNDNPEYFKNMGRRMDWLSKSCIDGVYITPEKAIKNSEGYAYASYGLLFQDMLDNLSSLMKYRLCTEDLKKWQNKKSDLMKIFKPYCDMILTKYNALLQDTNGKLSFKKANNITTKYPEECVDFTYKYRNGCLEYGERLHDNIFRIYIIPSGTNITPQNAEYVDMDIYDYNFDGLMNYNKNKMGTR